MTPWIKPPPRPKWTHNKLAVAERLSLDVCVDSHLWLNTEGHAVSLGTSSTRWRALAAALVAMADDYEDGPK